MVTDKGSGNSKGGSREPARLITIKSEKDAFHYLQMALANELGDKPIKVEFKNWPILEIKLEGKGYDSSITSQMAEALVELQHALNRTYARTIRGSSNANVLTNEEKRSIQFKAKVESGSSIFSVDIGQFAEKLAVQLVSKMDGQQVVVVILGTAVVSASLLAYKFFLSSRSNERKIEQETKARVELSTEETKRLEIVTKALNAQPVLKAVKEDFDVVRHEIVRGVSDADSLKVQGIELSNAEARSFAATPRTQAEDVQLNGNYKIVKIDWSKEDAARISLYSTESKAKSLEFIATMSTDFLTSQDKEKLKESEWGRKTVYMSINATKIRGEVTTATIVGVEWPKAEPKPSDA